MNVIGRRIGLAALLTICVSNVANGHGGGLDRSGCHTNRKTGDYHCHGGGAPETSAAPSASPQRSAVPPTVQRVSASTLPVRGSATTAAGDLTRAAQVLLAELGYNPSLLGERDSRTQAAVRAFQRTENLSPDGAVSEYVVLRLAEAVARKCE